MICYETIVEFDALASAPLSRDVMVSLVRGELDAVRIRNVASLAQCRRLTDGALRHQQRRRHAAVKGLDILGTPHYLAVTDEVAARQYYSGAASFSPTIRELSVPYGSPMDAIFGVLNDAWPSGVIAGRLDSERPMPPGIIRVYQPKSAGVAPHIDDIRQEVPTSDVAQSFIGQFGFNLYANLPPEGGELVIYDRLPTLEEFQKKASGYSWSEELAGEPKYVVRPSLGELILINTRRLHAVSACSGDDYRVTISGFGGMSRGEVPMMLWG
jgi:hypothetical protein